MELVAELGAVLLGDLLAVGSAFENHAAYLQHRVRSARESSGVLFQVLGKVHASSVNSCYRRMKVYSLHL